MKERVTIDQGSEFSQTILFDISKNELFKINDNYKILHRKLKSTWKVGTNKDAITSENDQVHSAKIFVLAGPRAPFTPEEIEYLNQLLKSGNSLLILLAEGGDHSLNTNINEFLEPYKITVNNDCVIRTQYYKYFHPKECYLNDGASMSLFGHVNKENSKLCHIYPFGATLTVARPAVVTLSSGNACFPANRPLCAVHLDRQTGGRFVVLGSGHMFSDKYIEQESNDKFCDMAFKFLTDNVNDIGLLDADEFDIWEYHMVPDIPMLADKPQLCLVDSVANSSATGDFMKLFNTKLHSLNTDLVPEIIDSYEEMNLKHSPLTLIIPHFEDASPPLQLAVFPPSFCELPAPPLELYDLEEEFSSEETQLAQLTNKCLSEVKNNKELRDEIEHFVKESCNILGIGQVDFTAKRLIYECAVLVSNFKMQNVLEQHDNDSTDKQMKPGKKENVADIWDPDKENDDQDDDLGSISS